MAIEKGGSRYAPAFLIRDRPWATKVRIATRFGFLQKMEDGFLGWGQR